MSYWCHISIDSIVLDDCLKEILIFWGFNYIEKLESINSATLFFDVFFLQIVKFILVISEMLQIVDC